MAKEYRGEQPTPCKEPGVLLKAMAELESEIDELSCTINALESRLAPVLVPDVVDDKEDVGGGDTCAAPIIGNMRSASYKIVKLQDRLKDIMSRCVC
jgi:hypothetical protein